MTDETEGVKSAPGSAAGDAAPTQAIPRIPKPEGKTATGVKSAEPAEKSPAPSETETDKGRPRPAPPVSKSQPATTPKPPLPPIGGPQGRPLTAADYVRTTKGSPATTAVIPAVKDKGGDDAKDAKPHVTITPAPSVESGRRASLRLTRVEPWSVTRLAFATSVALMIVAVVAAAIFWAVLNMVGVWDQINDALTSVLSDDSSSFDVKDYFGFGRFVGLTLVLSAINVVLMTVLATITAHLYNLAAGLMGGVEVTFTEDS